MTPLPEPTTPLYDSIGETYVRTRQADPAIVAALADALELEHGEGDARLIDVGAGTANYGIALVHRGACLTAVEISDVMLAQARRQADVAGVGARVALVRASADRLPFADRTFPSLLCTLALHHFADAEACIAEMMRVTAPGGRVVLLTADPRTKEPLWIDDYFPFLLDKAIQVYSPIDEVRRLVAPYARGAVEIVPMPLRRDVRDLFFLAGWARPRLYLDGTVRAGISHFAKAMRDPREAAVVADAVARLDKDLASGRWQRDFGAPMADKPTYDGGYRIVAVTRR